MGNDIQRRASTGVSGLDEVLGGGLTPNRLYVLEGEPGSGKTTLALQFLLAGVRAGEPGVYVSFAETPDELYPIFESHGWPQEGITLCTQDPADDSLRPESQYTVFHPSEVEMSATVQRILDATKKAAARRVVIDSLSDMRLLAQNPLRYRRQVMALKHFFARCGCTVYALDDRTGLDHDRQLRTIAHGVIDLEQLSPELGPARRRLRVSKMRGMEYRGGYHDFLIKRGGLEVFPTLVASEHAGGAPRGQIASGVEALDSLLNGGLDRGTSTLLLGPAGCGKSSIAAQYAVAAAARGERASIFSFDESVETLLTRAESLGLPLRAHAQAGRVTIRQVDPAALSPGEFSSLLRAAVEPADGQPGASVVVIDSLNGFLNAMPEERYLISQLHELLTYMGHRGVATILVVAQHGITGDRVQSPVDTSYLADTILLLRYFEAAGEVRQAISVMKRRSGPHERSIRELKLGAGGVRIGPPLRNFHGILTGVPQMLNGHADAARETADAAR